MYRIQAWTGVLGTPHFSEEANLGCRNFFYSAPFAFTAYRRRTCQPALSASSPSPPGVGTGTGKGRQLGDRPGEKVSAR